MRRGFIGVLALAIAIASVIFLQRQGRAEKIAPVTPAQNYLQSEINSTTEKLRALMGQQTDESSPALQSVAQFLQLTPDQIAALVQFLQARQSALAPLIQSIVADQEQLYQLLNFGGAAPAVGQLVIQINALQDQVMLAQRSFLANLENILDQDQRQKLEAVHLAVQVQPIVPAFQQLGLL